MSDSNQKGRINVTAFLPYNAFKSENHRKNEEGYMEGDIVALTLSMMSDTGGV